jgi:pimeloyl-ACP methyl ester carboxylesterase
VTTPPRAAYAFNDDAAIAYGVVGDGPVDVVYIQGFVSHVELMWECPQAVAFFERIAGWARLITIDRRGTGMSDRFSANDLPPLEEAARDVLAVMDAVGSQRASIVGHHEGGQLGAMLAALHPERVRTLTLIETAIAWRRWVEELQHGPMTDDVVDAMVTGWGRTFGTRAEEQEMFADQAPSHPGDRDLFHFLSRLQRFSASPNSAVGFVKLLFATDIGGILDSIDVPTQVLHRAEDRQLDVRYGRELAAAIPGAEFVELPGGDWWPFLGDTEPLLDALERFVLGAPVSRRTRPSRALVTVLFTDIVDSTARSASLGDEAWGDLRGSHDVECAQRIVHDAQDLGVEIRAGLHTGEVTFEDGDVAGIAVAIGARVSAKAGPSEILVSQTVKDLVAGSGLIFQDAGEHELKGVPDRWRLFKVVG